MPGVMQREEILAIHLRKHMDESRYVAVEPSIAHNVHLLTSSGATANGNGCSTSVDRPLKVRTRIADARRYTRLEFQGSGCSRDLVFYVYRSHMACQERFNGLKVVTCVSHCGLSLTPHDSAVRCVHFSAMCMCLGLSSK